MSTSTPASSTPVVANALQPDPDYSQFQFQQERVNYHTTFALTLPWLTERAKHSREVNYNNIVVNPNGEIAIGKINYTCTKWAFEQFCARLGIPRPFAKKIPPDLLLSNITRLIQENALGGDSTLLFHFVTFAPGVEVIVGCTKDDYQFVDADDFVTAAAAMDGNGYRLADLIVTDRMIEVDLLLDYQQVKTAGKLKFDIGVNLRSSDCGDVNPTARLCLYQELPATAAAGALRGMVLSTEWGRVDRIRNKKMTIETTFQNFMGHVVEMIIPIPQLEKALNLMETQYATDAGVKNYYDTFNRAIDNKEAIDHMLGWTEDERKTIFKDIGIRRKNNVINKLQGKAIVADPPLNFTEMKLADLAADYASNAVQEEREALRRLAGSFLVLG